MTNGAQKHPIIPTLKEMERRIDVLERLSQQAIVVCGRRLEAMPDGSFKFVALKSRPLND